jgi:hypothetical protein
MEMYRRAKELLVIRPRTVFGAVLILVGARPTVLPISDKGPGFPIEKEVVISLRVVMECLIRISWSTGRGCFLASSLAVAVFCALANVNEE